MRILLIILLFSFQAQGQALFHAHNRVQASGPIISLPPITLGLAVDFNAENIDPSTGSVTEWRDVSGHDYHLQAAAGQEPTYTPNAINGLPAVTNPGDKFLERLHFLQDAPAATLFVVLRIENDPPSTYAGAPVFATGVSGQDNHYPYSDGVIYEHFGSTERKTTGNPTPSLTAWHLYEVISAPSDWRSYINGTLHHSTATNTVSFANANFNVFKSLSNTFMQGQIARILIYDRALGSDEQATVRTYLQTRYGL